LLPEPQNEAEASYTREISKEDGKIDWTRPASHIWRQVRAYRPWPGAYTSWQAKHLKLIEVLPWPSLNGAEKVSPPLLTAAETGRVVALPPPDTGVAVVTGDGFLRVLRLQIEGKRAMSAGEFLRGQRNFIGSILHEL
jgi:methionyl-tRNA formyltransferase